MRPSRTLSSTLRAVTRLAAISPYSAGRSGVRYASRWWRNALNPDCECATVQPARAPKVSSNVT